MVSPTTSDPGKGGLFMNGNGVLARNGDHYLSTASSPPSPHALKHVAKLSPTSSSSASSLPTKSSSPGKTLDRPPHETASPGNGRQRRSLTACNYSWSRLMRTQFSSERRSSELGENGRDRKKSDLNSGRGAGSAAAGERKRYKRTLDSVETPDTSNGPHSPAINGHFNSPHPPSTNSTIGSTKTSTKRPKLAPTPPPAEALPPAAPLPLPLPLLLTSSSALPTRPNPYLYPWEVEAQANTGSARRQEFLSRFPRLLSSPSTSLSSNGSLEAVAPRILGYRVVNGQRQGLVTWEREED